MHDPVTGRIHLAQWPDGSLNSAVLAAPRAGRSAEPGTESVSDSSHSFRLLDPALAIRIAVSTATASR